MNQKIDNLKKRLSSQMSRGEPVLFLGAGFSLCAKNQAGLALPSSNGLAEELWSITFPDDAFEKATKLGDVFHCALERGKNKLTNFIQRRFFIDSETLPEFYKIWFSMPWHICYTLNIDDIEISVQRKFSLPRNIQSISATTGNISSNQNVARLQVVHLNGKIGDPIERLTFSEIDYGERLSNPDPWLLRSSMDILSRPVVYVGTELHEPTLWQHIENRRHRGGRHTRELRPGSYLIAPTLSKTRQLLLKNLNVDWIPMTAQQFAESWLTDLHVVAQSGLNVILTESAEETRSITPSLVSELSAQNPPKGNTEYLQGQQPTWWDLQSGRAIHRECDEKIYDIASSYIKSDSVSPPFLLSGTAGSGKSTALMRLALRLTSDGIPVYWIDESSNINTFKFQRLMAQTDRPVAVLIDDADLLGRSLTSWAVELPRLGSGVIFCVALRSSRIDGLMDSSSLGGIEPMEISIPHLTDSDIKSLIEVLDKENRLGVLKGMSTTKRIKAFQKQAGRQLLVGMIQATSGRRFTEKVYEEFKELGDQHKFLYGIVCMISSQRYTINRNELLLACGNIDNETLNTIELLYRRGLIVRRDIHTGYEARHRVIAEELTRHIEFRQWLGPIVTGVVFSFSSTVDPTLPKSDRRWRRLIRFINHDYLMKLISIEDSRLVYERIESVLHWDYHYWLQRGSLEVEIGDLSLATNFLDQARSLASNDRFVENEYAYLQMKKAISDPSSPDAPDMFSEGYNTLKTLISADERQNPHPYHVLGSQVLAWTRRASMGTSEKSQLLTSALSYVKRGMKFHPHSKDLSTLEKDIEREWLKMAVPNQNPGSGNLS